MAILILVTLISGLILGYLLGFLLEENSMKKRLEEEYHVGYDDGVYDGMKQNSPTKFLEELEDAFDEVEEPNTNFIEKMKETYQNKAF